VEAVKMNALAKLIKLHRKKAGLTQKQLADLASLGKTVIFDIEKGKETIQFRSLLLVLNVLNLKLKVESSLLQKSEVINEES